MAKNKFPTYCTDCEEKMPAGHGEVSRVGGRWVVSHAPTGRSLSADQFPDPSNSDDGYDALKDGVRERWG